MTRPVVIAGGGPAGLAAAIEIASRAVPVRVLERRSAPWDKACGEGLMPSGVAWLEKVGARALLGRADASPFRGVRYVQEDGSSLEGTLPRAGLGVRRLALVSALRERATALGVELSDGTELRSLRQTGDEVVLETSEGELRTPLLVAADGLHSPVRRALGLGLPESGSRRFGVRRHYALAPWTDHVEVHLSEGVEAYVTPVGDHRVGIALLFEQSSPPLPLGEGRVRDVHRELLQRFPILIDRLQGATPDSAARGAGPFVQRARSITAHRVVLLGDAAGYVDAITGEGVSLAFHTAEVLGTLLEPLLDEGQRPGAMKAYERAWRSAFRRYAVVANTMLSLARRPRLRRRVVHTLRRTPGVFDRLLALALR